MRISFSSLITFLFLLCVTHPLSPKSKSGPTIGILTTPRSGIHHSESEIKIINQEFLLSGGDVNIIPIPWDLETHKFTRLLNSVNGILLQGGTTDLWNEDEYGNQFFSAYQRTVNYVMYHVMKKNQNGEYFPLWGICEGLEAAAIALTKDVGILDDFNHEKVYESIIFTKEAQRSKMFQEFDKEDFVFAAENPSVFYNHEFALNVSVPNLYSAFRPGKWLITSINKDDEDAQFINSMESVEFPIFLHMFHPERALHDALHQKDFKSAPQVVSIATKLAQSFLKEAKRNHNSFRDPGLREALLIENFDKEGEYYVFTRNSFNNHWFSVHESTRDTILLGALALAAVGMISFVVWMYFQKDKRDELHHHRLNYERIETIKV